MLELPLREVGEVAPGRGVHPALGERLARFADERPDLVRGKVPHELSMEPRVVGVLRDTENVLDEGALKSSLLVDPRRSVSEAVVRRFLRER
jgi:hypothetical protein